MSTYGLMPPQPWASTWQGLTPTVVPPPTSPLTLPGFGGANIPPTLAAQAEAGAAGGQGGILSRLVPSLPVNNPEAGGLLQRYAAPGMTRWGMAGRLGVGGLAGLAGSNLIDRLDIGGNQSNWEQGLQGASVGAGIGAGVGSIVPGIGTGVGALVGGGVGGAVGVLSNIFGGDDEEEVDPFDTLVTAMNSAGLDPATHEQILTQYDTLMALAEGLPEGDAQTPGTREHAVAVAFEQTSQMILAALAQQQQAASVTAPNTLALQQQAMQTFEPLAQDIETNASLYAQAMAGIRDQLPESYRAVADATVARELTSADKLANAYRAQAALTPIAQQLTQYQQDQASYASQLWQQQMAAGMGGQPTANDLLAQLG